jgi:hypothetical protein
MENSNEDAVPVKPKGKPGRPPGSKKGGQALTPLGELHKWDNYTTPPKMDYRHEDVETLVGRQLSMVGLAQDRVRQEMLGQTASGQPGKVAHCITLDDVERLNDLSNALVRSIDALQRATKVADELRSKLTPEQVLEGAIQKIMAQDTTTLANIVKRLTYKRKKDPKSAQHLPKTIGAAEGIASLED